MAAFISPRPDFTHHPLTSTSMLSPIRSPALGYRHLPALGGLRHRKKAATPSLNTFWQVAAFRNYADYSATDAFRDGLDELRALAGDNCCAIMCGKAAWWRCHRRVIADYLLAEGVPVSHITGMNKIDRAKFTPGVRLLRGGTLVYPAVEEETVNA